MTEPTINNRDRYFKGQQEEEVLICFFRRHEIALFRELLFFAIFLTLVVLTFAHLDLIQEFLRGNREIKMLFYTAFLMGTIYIHRFFIRLINYYLNVVLITNMRIIDKQRTLFFRDKMDSLDMGQIQNIEKVQEGVLPNLLGFGDIKIYLNASDTVVTFNTVPNANFHFRCLNRQKEARHSSNNRISGGINPIVTAQATAPIPFEVEQPQP